MKFGRKLRLAMTIGAAASALSFGLIAPAVSGASAPSGVLTFAEGPGASPNYIFPYMSCQFFSVSNINQFQQLMFRPLYWFGLGNSAAVSYPLSPAKVPVFSHGNKTITIKMKGWKFASGQVVNAQSVMFFMNMLKADPSGYCGYNGAFTIPDLIKSVSGRGNTVVIQLTKPVNPGYMIYNNLSFITPFPKTWDTTGNGVSGKCSTGAYGAASTTVACKNVEAYLNAQSAISSTYTNRMWQSGVDGPWKLTQYDNLGNVTFQPNSKYSGPVKGHWAQVKEVAYTTTQAEENDLQAHKINLGYVDTTILTANAPKPGGVGPNWGQLANSYNLLSGNPWSFNYAPFNFSSSSSKAAALSQLYIRQALQLGVDQPGIISNVFKNYAFPDYSPLPPVVAASISGPVSPPYPFDLTKAAALLSSHGWTVTNGVQTCTSPGTGASQCGAGIAAGYTLNFKLVYASGSPSLDSEWAAIISDWAKIGIQFSKTTETFNHVIADCSSGSDFQICMWGGGWVYAPDYYPSGESLFIPAGGFNVGQYNDAQMTSLVTATDFGTAKLTAFENYAAQQLPVLFLPNPAGAAEVVKGLKDSVGFASPLQNFMPEYMHY